MPAKIRALILGIMVAALGSECGPAVQQPAAPSGGQADEQAGEDVEAAEEAAPPGPPKAYVGPWKQKGDKPAKLLGAEKSFEEKNYKQALEAYEAFVEQSPDGFWVPHAKFQSARCHYLLSEYDEALDLLTTFVESKPGLLWEARARQHLASLFHALPTYGYEKDDKVTYNYENHEGEYRYMYEENRDIAIGHLETARLDYIAILAAGQDERGATAGDDIGLEAVDVDFLLIRDIDERFWNKGDACPPDVQDPPKPDAAYDPEWTPREKTLYLLDEIPRLNEGRTDAHPAAWAGFKKALFLMRYPECPTAEWQEKVAADREAWESKQREAWEDKTKKPAKDISIDVILEDLKEPDFVAPRWNPGKDLDPMAILDGLLEKHAGDRHEDLYEATRGKVLEGRGEYLSAMKVYEEFLAKHPKSPWASDVKNAIFGIEAPYLYPSAQEFTYRGDEARLGVNSRNHKTVDVGIYEVDFPSIMKRKANLDDPYTRFTDLDSMLVNFKGAAKTLKKGSMVWSTTYKTKDKGDHRSVYGYVDLPDLPLGTYFINVHAGPQEHILPWIRTDLIIVGKTVKDEVRYVLTDSKTGATVADFPILVKEVYEKRKNDWGWVQEVKITQGQTDKGGRYTYALTKGSEVGYNRVQALANVATRMAMTSEVWGPYTYSSETGETYRIFTVTDRPVYRTGDTIRFKHVIRAYKDGKNQLQKGLKVKMEITNPKGERIFEKTVDASAYGGAWGEAEIPEEAPLGVYYARAYVVEHEWRCYQSAGSTFRVEEYKKPEFEVEVLPAKKLATAGDEVEARVKATYYFGAPVAEAKVSYKIFRTVFQHFYAPPDRWDWLFGEGYGLVYDRPYSYGEELVDEGEGTTDDLGELLVKLPKIDEKLSYDYEYKVVAEVTDPSRRVISGAGTLKVTRDPYYAYVWPGHGFYTEGDEIEVELVALTADDEPVPAKGKVEVVRLEYKPGGEIVENAVSDSKIELDSAGRSFFEFKAVKPGQYRVRFTSTHEKSKEVVGEQIVTVAGKEFLPKWFRFGNVEVTSEKRSYLRGETIHMLVQSPWPDATLWVTYEGGDEVFHDEILRPSGVGTVLEVEASEQLHPNFFVRVTAVRDGVVSTVSREMFIPPGEEILEVAVTSDKGEYKPRSKGQFSVEVRDYQGKPVEGEFSLAVFDSSVLYIQGETTGDIRSYFYGNRRYHDVSEFHSGQIWMSSFSRDNLKWPEYFLMGLPDSSGYFREPYYDRGVYFTCPSCQKEMASPWRLDLPEGSVKDAIKSAEEGGKPKPAEEEQMEDAGGKQGKHKAKAPKVAAAQAMIMGKGGGGGYGMGMGGLAESTPSGSATPMEKKAEAKGDKDYDAEIDARDGGVAGAEEIVREEFPDTALWVPDLVTGKDGKASKDIKWPDSLTTWAVRVFGADGSSRVGLARMEVITTKKLVARIETPRFMVEGDEVTLAAVVHNSYPDSREVALSLSLEGGVDPVGSTEAKITVPAGKDARHDFKVVAVEASSLKVKLSATTEGDSDALVKKLEVMEWGSDKMVARAASMSAPGKMTLELDLPAERRKDTTELVVALEPTVAGVILQSIPYLVRYPYGCVEQTMSRFRPAALVARSLKDLGIKLAEIPKLAEQASLANPASKAQGEAGLAWWEEPIYDDAELDKIIKIGLARLYSFQHSDGGWAWWREGDSDPYMTAYVVTGLWEARQAGYNVDPQVVDRGMRFLDQRYAKMRKEVEKKTGWQDVELSHRHLMTYMAYALSLEQRIKFEDIEGIYKHREALTHYGKCLLALALANVGEKEKATLAVENLADLAWVDEKNQTASFKFEAKEWWRWYNNRVETVAWALRAFTEIDPSHPHGARFARWLVNNREGNRWYSTKDTALVILGLDLYMRQHQEFDADYDVTVKVNGKTARTYHQDKKSILSGLGRVFLSGDALDGKKVKIEVSAEGKGAVYANAFLSYFTKEKEIEGDGNEIFVERTYYKLTEKKKKVKTWHGEITKLDYTRTELRPGDAVSSGDLVEVKIMIDSKNDYEYLVFEDWKPAGFEPTELKSGGFFEHGAWLNREFRDEKVVTFLYELEQGKQALTYKLRAEIPGNFRVLPHKGYAMYAPRVRAISDSWQISVSP